MADQLITKQELIDAQKDAQTLEEVINGEPGKLVKTRLNRMVYTLASVPQINTMTREEVTAAVAPKANDAEVYKKTETFTKTEINALVAPKANQADVDSAISGMNSTLNTSLANLSTTANKYYSTLAAANADIANIALNQSVTIGEEANSGLWEKKTAGATSLTKSPYDPLTQAKSDATTKANTAETNAKNYSNSEISATKKEIIEYSSNLFDVSKSTKDKVIGTTGAITDTVGFAYSDYIKVDPSQAYYFDGFRGVSQYNSNKEFISRSSIDVVSGKVSATETTSSATYYVRLNYRYDLSEQNDTGRKVNKGAVSLTYEQYYIKLRTDLNVAQNAGWIFEAKNIKDKAITQEKTTFIKTANNLFRPELAVIGSVILADGIISTNVDYSYSDFIAVESGQKYTLSADSGYNAFVNVACYDANKIFINRIDTLTSSGPLTITIPTGAKYIRFNMNAGTPAQHSRMFNKGEIALPFEAYYDAYLDGVTLNPAEIEKIKQEIGGGNNPSEGYIAPNSNLFFAAKSTVGYAILADGTIAENSQYSVSDFITVVSGDQYTISGGKVAVGEGITGSAFVYAAYYDANKNFIERVSTFNEDGLPKNISIPANVNFVRFSLNAGLPDQYNRMFNKGAVAMPYEPGRIELTGLSLGHDVLAQIGEELEIEVTDNIMIDTPISGVFSTDQTWPDITDFRNVTSAQVYQMYDDLMALHPTYITKQALGNDAWGNPIALYKLTPPKPDATVNTRYPKIFLTAGVHGMEHTPPLACYLMFEQMCNNWQSDSLLEALRFNVEFLIIPVAVPTGWNKYARVNDNGVDINRNFPELWTLQGEGTNLYGGPSPASELETQYIMSVFDQNPDIDIMYDFHNFNGLPDDPLYWRVIWIPTGSVPYVQHMAQMLISRMTRKWKKEYNWLPQELNWFAGWTDATHGAMVQDHARERGIKFSATFEVAGKIWLDPDGGLYTVAHKKIMVEALINWILINLNEVKRI